MYNRATAVRASAPQERRQHPGSAAAAVLSYYAGLPEMPLAGFYSAQAAWMPSSSPRMRIVAHPAGGEEGVEEEQQQLAAAGGGTAAEGASSGAAQGGTAPRVV